MFAAIIIYLTSLNSALAWDNLNRDDRWDCYTIENNQVCQTTIQPCRWEKTSAECTVEISFGAPEKTTYPCRNVPDCTVELWPSIIDDNGEEILFDE